jgi:hypothetical protein
MGEETENLVAVKSESARVCGLRKKTFIIILSIFTGLIVAGVAIGVGVYYGIVEPAARAAAGSGQQQLTVSEIGATTTSTRKKRSTFNNMLFLNKRQAAGTVSSSHVASTGSYNFAQVDGLRLKVISVTFTPSDTATQMVTSNFESPKDIEIGGSVGNGAVKSFTVSVKAPVGTYTKASVRVQNTYGVKAYW